MGNSMGEGGQVLDQGGAPQSCLWRAFVGVVSLCMILSGVMGLIRVALQLLRAPNY